MQIYMQKQADSNTHSDSVVQIPTIINFCLQYVGTRRETILKSFSCHTI